MRRLPRFMNGGPIVSDVAYRIVELALQPREVDDELAERARAISTVELAQRTAELLEVDEADVLRGWAELKRVGVMQ